MSIIVTLSLSCAYQYPAIQVQERILFHNDIETLVIMPFLNLAEEVDVAIDVSELFASELARFREVSVVHPNTVATHLQEYGIQLNEKNIIDEARKTGVAFGVDTVILGSVTEYSMYYPPVFGLSIMVINVDSGKVIASKTEVYDSSFNYVRNEVTEYAAVKQLNDSLFKEEVILQKFDLYIRFVCHQIISKYL